MPNTSVYVPHGTELDRLTDEELLARCRELPADSLERAAAREILVRRYEPIVRGCVRQYRGSPDPSRT